MAAQTTKVTTDHDEIRRWVEERGGWPAHVKGTGTGDDPGVLRIDFPGYSGEETLEPISWDDWFRKFDANGLAFIFQERKANGEISYFNKLVSRDSVEDLFEEGARRARPEGRQTSTTRSTSRTTRTTAGTRTKGSTKQAAKTATSKAKSAGATKRGASPRTKGRET
ncbi:MAG TPA: hypothetical protein VF488_06525 [Gemmatimonadaceae bacterium]